MSATLRELADEFSCRLHGDPDRVITGVGTLGGAGPASITFLANRLYRAQLAATRAGAVILEEKDRSDCPTACLVHERPYATYARIAAFLHPAPAPSAGVHASAVVAPTTRVASSAEIGAQVVIGAGCTIGDSAVIGPGSVLGANVEIGAGTRLVARVTVLDGVRIGARCIVHAGAVIGADGFGFAPDAGRWVKIPQLGSVVIGDDVEIGANTTIDRGTIDDTVIEDGVKLDNLVQVAHNVRVGAHTVMAAMSGAAGSTKIGKRCMIGGGAAMINSLEICDDAVLTFRSAVLKSIAKPGVYSGALPAEEAAQWRRNAVRFRRLDEFVARLVAAERLLDGLAKRRQQKKKKKKKKEK
jgi:UDP-3-O-[3-hydroxymyristoyl] glucosamine N-acyltransferase